MKSLIAKFYPDATASVTRKRQNLAVKGPKSCRWNEKDAARREAVRALGALEVASLLGIDLGVGGEPPLSCQASQKSTKPQNERPVGLTKRGGKTLRRAFASWETVTSPGTMAFGTLTLSDAALDAVCSHPEDAPDVVYQRCLSYFMDKLRRLLRSRGLPGDVIWVTEMHPARSQRRGMFIPHVHFVAQTAEKRYQWLVKPSEIEYLWKLAISAYTSVDESIDLRSRCEIKCVKKSVARYVSKYLRKSKDCVIAESQNLDRAMVPKRWYAVANALHKLVRKQTVVISGHDAARVLDWLQAPDNPLVKRWGNIELPGESGRPVWLATWAILRLHPDHDGIRLLALS